MPEMPHVREEPEPKILITFCPLAQHQPGFSFTPEHLRLFMPTFFRVWSMRRKQFDRPERENTEKYLREFCRKHEIFMPDFPELATATEQDEFGE